MAKKTAKKKATAKTSRVSPPVPNDNPNVTKYEDLANGDCFLFEGCLMMRWDFGDQEAFDLNGKGYRDCLCDEVVIPVNIAVTWTRK